MTAPISSHHFHVAVVGNDLSAYATATLLSKEGYRVVWLRPAQSLHTEIASRFVPVYLLSPVTARYLHRISLPSSLVEIERAIHAPLLLASAKTRVDVVDERLTLAEELQREFPDKWQSLQNISSEIFDASAMLEPSLKSFTLDAGATWLRRWRSRRLLQKAQRNPGVASSPVAQLPENHVLRAGFELCTHLSANYKRPDPVLQCWHFQTWSRLHLKESVWQSDLLATLEKRFRSFGGTIIEVGSFQSVNKTSQTPYRLEVTGAQRGVTCDVVVQIEGPKVFDAATEPSHQAFLVTQVKNNALPDPIANRTVFVKPGEQQAQALLQFVSTSQDSTSLYAYVQVGQKEQAGSDVAAHYALGQALRCVAPFTIADLHIEQCVWLPASLASSRPSSDANIWGERVETIAHNKQGDYLLSQDVLQGFGPEGRLLAAEALCNAVAKNLPRKSWMKRRAWLE